MSIPENDLTKIEIDLRDPDDQLVKLIAYISRLSAPGHSFEVIVDPDVTKEEGKESFFIDGDGAFYIKNLKMNGKKVQMKDGKILENYLRDLQC